MFNKLGSGSVKHQYKQPAKQQSAAPKNGGVKHSGPPKTKLNESSFKHVSGHEHKSHEHKTHKHSHSSKSHHSHGHHSSSSSANGHSGKHYSTHTQEPGNGAPGKKPDVTGHWIGKQAILPDESMPKHRRDFLLKTNMNTQYSSMKDFNKRADNWSRDRDFEKGKVESTKANLNNIHSNEFKQSAHMAHTQRADFWLRNQDMLQNSPAQYQKEVKRNLDTSLHYIRSGAPGDKNYDDLMHLMIEGKQGPLTKEQSKLGIEAAMAGHENLQQKRNQETDGKYGKTRMKPDNRQGHSRQAFGVDLTNDYATRKRQDKGMHTLMGTSGTSSDIVRSHQMALANVKAKLDPNQRFGADSFKTPGETDMSTTNLTFNFMRGDSAPTNITAKEIDYALNKQGNRISQGSLFDTQTHAYSEVKEAVLGSRDLALDREFTDKYK
ncbi:hypothetical protein TDB9533_00661 [Thalassocella blandensis]|nr:hypothetical protein TDB9533_00661 [Thalassocella blandensis]